MIKGWVDLSRATLQERRAPGASGATTRSFVSPGVEITLRGADIVVGDNAIVVCEGAARFHDDDAQRVAAEQGEAAAWLRLLRRRGPGGLSFARGAYALVFIDLEARSAILACDRFAVQPLCYAFEHSRLAFADRVDSVPTTNPAEIDLQAIYDYLYFHVIPTPRTIFRGVQRLPPAHAVHATPTALRVEPHWTPTFEEPRTVRFDDLKSEFRALVREAVAREADSDHVGCFLSGGTDSSTVSGMLTAISGKPAATYSIGFEAEGYDEMTYARLAARHFGTQHHEYYVTPDDLVRGIPEVARHYDQPFGNSSAVPAYLCARMAKRDGLAKLLAGDGGDELFGGNKRYATQRVYAAYESIPRAVRSIVLEPMLLGSSWPEKVPLVRKAVRYVSQAKLPMPDRMNGYNLLEWLGIPEVLESALLARIDIHDPARQQRLQYQRATGSLVNAMLAYDWKYTLADNDLPKVCGTAALAEIAVGFPLLADELVDFSLRLPSSLKLRGLKLRYFFKEALRGFLPDEILVKKKHGFGLPFGHWLVKHKPLHDLARASLDSLAKRGFVRKAFIGDLMDHHVPAHPGYFGEMVWIFIMLEQWLASKAPQFAIADARR